jgi:hypothetical protein
MRALAGGWLGFVGLAVAASSCGGMSTSAGDASVDGAAGDGGSSGSGGGSGSGSSGSGSGSGGSSGSSGGSSGCDAACGGGRVCCLGECVSTTNDPNNCGGCGIKCGPGTYCNLGPPNPGNGGQSPSCLTIPCPGKNGCGMGDTCCGTSCCTPGQLCCQSQGGPVAQYPSCYTPTAAQPTCPPGCPLCISDRNLKRDIEPVDDQAVLEGVARMPISTWSYKSDDPSVRHLGPMAQDFHAAFGLGDTDRAYYAIDAHGVAFAAIRALSEQVKEQNARIERMEQENRALRERVTCGP